eukprot:jgi/Ulvmu1/8825/UM049_0005.1
MASRVCFRWAALYLFLSLGVVLAQDGGRTAVRATAGSPAGNAAGMPLAPAPTDTPVNETSSTGEEGAARLVSRVDVNGYATGALQVFCEGAWGAVCSAGFDDVDAAVACRQLGFIGGVRQPVPSLRFGPRLTIPDPAVVAPFALGFLGCSGGESRIVDCPIMDSDDDYARPYYDENQDTCDPFLGTYAMIACGTRSDFGAGSVRLINGEQAADGSAEYGRLEIFHSGGWGTVCGGFDNDAGTAAVACRQLGYQQGFQIQKLEDAETAKTERVPIVLAGCTCEGTETSVAQCPGAVIGRVTGSTCMHDDDVHLVCFNGPNPELDGMVRLQDGDAGPAYEYGRLEVFSRGFWSNVCSDRRFTPDTAQLACRALGFDGGAAPYFAQPFLDKRIQSQVLFKNLPVALASVDCDGDEASILECRSNDNLVLQCDNITSSTVLACANSEPGCDVQEGSADGAVRLRGGFGTPCDPIHSGFVEVLNLGQWGSICGGIFFSEEFLDNLVADVVCRQLGFPHGTLIDPIAVARPRPPPNPDYEYVFDSYTTYESEFSSLVTEGLVTEEAEEPVERFWLTTGDVQCRGTEGRLVECDLGSGFQNNPRCGPAPYRLSVACRQFPITDALENITTPGAAEGDLRLVETSSSANWMIGRLQMFFEGAWGQVCASDFDAPDVNVACRQLGFGAGAIVPKFVSDADEVELSSVGVFPEVAFTQPLCTGAEARLLDCAAERPDDYAPVGRGCFDSAAPSMMLACVRSREPGVEGAFRLTSRSAGAVPGAESGILEVFHAGAWGSICDGDFGVTSVTADVACRGMGFISGFFDDAVPSPSLLPPWLSGLQCSNGDSEAGQCERSAFGDTLSCQCRQLQGELVCRPILRLHCAPSSEGDGQARLVDGDADPGGAWEYGRLEVVQDGFWSTVIDALPLRDFEDDFGRRAAQVACRSLGYTSGAQLLVGQSSPFATDRATLVTELVWECNGSEASLGECATSSRGRSRDQRLDADDIAFDDGFIRDSVALLCATPSGCSEPALPPSEGDVRLVPLNDTASPTAACDAVHFGNVELFLQGRWGRVCDAGEAEKVTLVPQVICRQLGFVSGVFMDAERTAPEPEFFFRDRSPVTARPPPPVFSGDSSSLRPADTVWARDVVCTGKEQRLVDCRFDGDDVVSISNDPAVDEGTAEGSYGDEVDGPITPVNPSSGAGLPLTSCPGELAVVCHRFQFTESDTIRR